MAITPEQIDALAKLLEALPAEVNPVGAVRAAFPGWVISRCEADDMRDEAPYYRSGAYEVYLLDSQAHCWRMTDAPEAATGVILAECVKETS